MLTISPYQSAYKEQIAQLITGIQQGEFGVPITLADQPDLQNIDGFYQSGSGNFWQAVTDDNKVVGTIALIDIGHQRGVIRKMFVHAGYRGKETEVALRLLKTLEQWASDHSIHTIYLGTINSLEAANRFYQKHHFDVIDESELPQDFPRMAVDNRFFRKMITRF